MTMKGFRKSYDLSLYQLPPAPPPLLLPPPKLPLLDEELLPPEEELLDELDLTNCAKVTHLINST